MERASRLRRYLRKDYSQLVDFPVEIVGRDGTIRRYSFDASVRLYNRRIHSAPMRYDDGELVDAEVRHCRNRIDQLRRSYLEHFGWGMFRDGQLGGLFGGPLAAEVAAFLRRAFSTEREGPSSLRVTLIESGVQDTFYVRCSNTGRGWMLYAWRFDAASPEAVREAWRATLERLAGAPVGETVERLLLATEGADYALALAGSGEWEGPDGEDVRGDEGAAPPDPLHAGLRALYDGHLSEALHVLEAGLDAAPTRLGIAQAASLVALLEDQPERAEFAARFGRLNHPGDPLVAYLLGVALARTGRRDEAASVVCGSAARRNPLLGLLEGVLALRAGRVAMALRVLVRVSEDEPDRGYAGRTARLLRGWILRAGLAATSGLLLLMASAVAGWESHSAVAAVLLVLGLLPIVGSVAWLSARARALATGERRRGVPRLVSLELLPRDRELEGHH